jgi:C-terminal processing protease CtpA/Prc
LRLTLVDSSTQRRSMAELAHYNHGDQAYQVLDDNIGYIRLDKMEGQSVNQMMTALANTKGLIIDIRSYPSKFVVFELGAHLYPSAYNFVRFTSMQTNHPGQFNWTEPLAVGGDNPDYYKGKVVILVDEATVSQAEYTAMAFRGAPSAIVIGNTTAGADGNVSGISLPGGHSTRLSGIGVYYADKTPTQRVGIVPDIEVLPTLKGVMAGRDEALERAMAYIKQ